MLLSILQFFGGLVLIFALGYLIGRIAKLDRYRK